MELREVVKYLDGYLLTAEMPDYPNALNGLQVWSDRPVSRVTAAVDASERAIERASALGSELLLVHHGLFWDGLMPVTGPRYRKLKRCLDSGLAVYSSHIPLDLHPDVGNSAVLARELGIEPEGTWADYRGVEIGVWGTLDLTREALAARLDEVLGASVRMLPGGPERLKRIGVVTGAGGGMIKDALRAGLDAFVTGEGAHHTYFEAMENGINVYYGGHYATETWGVRALAAQLEQRFGLPWEFLDLPTGM